MSRTELSQWKGMVHRRKQQNRALIGEVGSWTPKQEIILLIVTIKSKTHWKKDESQTANGSQPFSCFRWKHPMSWRIYPIQYLIFNLVIKGLIYGSCHHPETIQHPGVSLFFNCVTLEIVLNIRPSFKLGIKKAKKNPIFSQIFSSSSDMIMSGIPQARLIWFPVSSDTSFLMHSSLTRCWSSLAWRSPQQTTSMSSILPGCLSS